MNNQENLHVTFLLNSNTSSTCPPLFPPISLQFPTQLPFGYPIMPVPTSSTSLIYEPYSSTSSWTTSTSLPSSINIPCSSTFTTTTETSTYNI